MTVRTVLGDVGSSVLGATLVHEHLILDSPLIESDYPHIHLPSVDDAVAELEPCTQVGIGGMVDAMPAAGGRKPERLADISRRTGVAIVATTGLHTPKYYASHPWAIDINPDELSALFVADIEQGMDRHDHMGPVVERTEHRAGIIKVATDHDGFTERAEMLWRAAVDAAAVTRVPILTHCEDGLGAMAQIEAFGRLGFPLERVVISHTDKVADHSYHRDLMDSGVNLEYDQALRSSTDRENQTAVLAAEMIADGYVGSLMFGTDGARRSLWTTHGGAPGLAWMHTGFLDALGAHGASADDVAAVFVTNPQRFLSLAR
ncbi:MAG: phosphotriesterase family protein [Acidimicrobiia bacterium]